MINSIQSNMKEEGLEEGCMLKPRLIYLFIFLPAYEKLYTTQADTKLTAWSESRGVEMESTEEEK